MTAASGAAGRAAGRSPLRIAPAVAAALDRRAAVVALESTLVTHGLAWPHNLDAARRSEAAVAEGGALPATIAVSGGELLVGLDAVQLEALARAEQPLKASRGSLALALAGGGWAGTTVSATMVAAQRAGIGIGCGGPGGGLSRPSSAPSPSPGRGRGTGSQ